MDDQIHWQQFRKDSEDNAIKTVGFIYHESLPPYYFHSLAKCLNSNQILLLPIHFNDFLECAFNKEIPSILILSAIWGMEINRINKNRQIFNSLSQSKQLLFYFRKSRAIFIEY